MLPLIFLQLLLILTILAMIHWQFVAITSVPWIRTPRWKTRRMFELAGLRPGERVLDLGSGDGSIVIDAARDFGAAGHGIELQWSLWAAARLRARLLRLRDRVTFVRGNIFTVPLPEADVIFSYLFPEMNARLEPLLKTRYPSGTRVVSRAFRFPTLPMVASDKIGSETVRIYRIP